MDVEEEDPNDAYSFRSSGSEPPSKRAAPATALSGLPTAASPATTATIDANKYKVFRQLVNKMFQERHEMTLPEGELVTYVSANSTAHLFTRSEITAAFAKMSDDGTVMVVDGNVILTIA